MGRPAKQTRRSGHGPVTLSIDGVLGGVLTGLQYHGGTGRMAGISGLVVIKVTGS